MKFASRADVKTILKEKNGWEILQILWHSSDHLLKKAGLLWLAYETMPTTIEGLNSLHKKAKAFWTVNKIPSPEEMKQQSCGDLTRLRHQLDAMEEQGLGTTDTFFEASLRTHFYMDEKNCFSTHKKPLKIPIGTSASRTYCNHQSENSSHPPWAIGLFSLASLLVNIKEVA